MSDVKLEYIEKYNFKTSIDSKSGFDNAHEVDLVIIWLHGLGADYNDFAPIVDQLAITKKVKFIFPNAPIRPITINAGYAMRAWYDISSLVEIDQSFDYQGVMQSVELVKHIIALQIQYNIDPAKIVIAGFSQGGVVSYFTHLTVPYKLAGTIALSCYLPLFEKETKVKLTNNNYDSPLFIAHGQEDQVVPYVAGERAYRILSNMHYLASWYSYPIGHSVSNDELLDLSRWISNLI